MSKNDIRSEVMLLNDSVYNAWIDNVDEERSRTIPTTLIMNLTMQKRVFFER